MLNRILHKVAKLLLLGILIELWDLRLSWGLREPTEHIEIVLGWLLLLPKVHESRRGLLLRLATKVQVGKHVSLRCCWRWLLGRDGRLKESESILLLLVVCWRGAQVQVLKEWILLLRLNLRGGCGRSTKEECSVLIWLRYLRGWSRRIWSAHETEKVPCRILGLLLLLNGFCLT